MANFWAWALFLTQKGCKRKWEQLYNEIASHLKIRSHGEQKWCYVPLSSSHFALYKGKNRVWNVYVYFCRSIFADKSPALITHSMPTNSQIDEKIVNSKRALRLLANIQRKLGRLFFARCIKTCALLAKSEKVFLSLGIRYGTFFNNFQRHISSE